MTTWRPPKTLDAPPPMLEIARPRPCSKCKQPTTTTTPLGRAVHPTCEPCRDVLSPQATRRAMAELIAILRPLSIHQEPKPPPYVRGPQPTVLAPAPWPCAVCGTTHDVVRSLPHDVWRCWDHGPLQYPVRSWERRGLPGGDTR